MKTALKSATDAKAKPNRPMNLLCQSCQKLRIQRLPRCTGKRGETDGSRKMSTTNSMSIFRKAWHHSTLKQFRQRMTSCPFCGLLRTAFFHWFRSSREKFYYYFEHKMADSELGMYCIGLFKENTAGPIRRVYVALIYISGSEGYGPRTRGKGREIVMLPDFLIYSPKNSAARSSGNFDNQDILAIEAIKAKSQVTAIMAGPYIDKWLQECFREHKICGQSFCHNSHASRASGFWPSRLLFIYASSCDQAQLRIIETDGKYVGDYIALSHCWGPPEKRPLSTRMENIKQHKINIPFDNLPLTFKDAVMVCAALKIDYLWIDSLCIIQDNSTDWEQEAKIMGQIYEQATLTIAAQSAEDSTQGLFKVRDVPLPIAELPYYPKACQASGSLFAFDISVYNVDFMRYLNESPLQKRGWVMQEYLLSRRIVHFTKLGIFFTCFGADHQKLYERQVPEKVYRFSRSEFGVGRGARNIDTWTELVHVYSGRELTYKSDKLVAVQAIASAFARRDSITYYYGIFTEYFPKGLAWFPRDGKVQRDTDPNIPSWSWASATGRIDTIVDSTTTIDGKVGRSDRMPAWSDYKTVCQLVACRPSTHIGALEVRGKLITIQVPGRKHSRQSHLPHIYSFADYIKSLQDTDTVWKDIRQVWAHLRISPNTLSLLSSGIHTRLIENKKETQIWKPGIFPCKSPKTDHVVGWCYFDEDELVSGLLHLLPLYKRRRWQEVQTAEPDQWWSLLVRRVEEASTNMYQRSKICS